LYLVYTGTVEDDQRPIAQQAHRRGKIILTVLARAARLRCPVCGQAAIAAGPFRIRHHCPSCHSLFKREEGFFVGAILGNMLATELVILLVCLFWLTVLGANYETVLAGLFIVALVFPVAFYHHSWSFWLGFDYLIEGLPRCEKEHHHSKR
jgi:hypothetical protein